MPYKPIALFVAALLTGWIVYEAILHTSTDRQLWREYERVHERWEKASEQQPGLLQPPPPPPQSVDTRAVSAPFMGAAISSVLWGYFGKFLSQRQRLIGSWLLGVIYPLLAVAGILVGSQDILGAIFVGLALMLVVIGGLRVGSGKYLWHGFESGNGT